MFARMILCAGLALASCSGDERTAPPPSAATSDALCEHGVLEAVCTKCNPALIAVFQAKHDYCEEHGFAESFCPICHPERGGRPAADVSSAGEGPADGTKLRFKTKDTARRAGLQIAKAVSQATRRDLQVTARIVYDATRVAQINPRVSGVVRSIRADVGARVRAGAVLAVIESATVGAEQSRAIAARTRLEVAEANHTRVATLRAEGISPERDLLAARREVEEARAELKATQAALGMVGAADGGSGRYGLTSPLAGVVTQRNATVGRLVSSDDLAFEVVDPSEMWIELDVPEADASLVAIGQPVTLALDSLPGREFASTLSYVAPAVDARTRTVVARASLPNPDGVLRANLYGRARIAVTDARASVLVPRASVQRARAVNLVFVRLAEDSFEARRVQVGAAAGDLVSVTGRVAPGDEVVTEGSFLLKTETLRESIGAGCCEVE